MPGIAGFISAARLQGHPSTLDQMVGCLGPGPTFRSGTLLQQEANLGIGWVSHAGSFSDCNPVWNEQKDIGLIFSGEHFADPVEPERLRARGHAVDANDARWLVHLYEEEGPAFFEKLNGVFSGVLVDRRQAKVVLFNDRYGLGRIYFHESPDGFYFASEAKALLKVLPHLRQLDMAGFGEFFSCGCALQNRTLFKGLSLLPGASVWTFATTGEVWKGTYFSKDEWENQSAVSADEYYDRLNATFTRILPRYFQGTQRIGLSLTGGLDSRMIIACTPALPKDFPCYTFGGMYRECADVRLARQIAQVCGQSHQVIPVNGEFFAEFPALAARTVQCTDGAMDVTGAVEMFVNRVAREIAPVRMTGNYGSEILRGNVAFKPMPLNATVFEPSFAAQIRTAADTYGSERQSELLSFIAFKQVPWHHFARLAVEQSQLMPRSPYLDNDLVRVAFQSPADLAVNKMLIHRFIKEHNPALAEVPTDRGVVGSRQAKAGRWAVMCQEFMPRAEYAMDYGMPQWLAKMDRLMAPLRWERLFLGQQKFYHFRVWYRDELSAYVKAMLLDSRTLARSYLNRREVERIVLAHTGGYGNHTLEIHKLLTSELIQRQLIEQG